MDALQLSRRGFLKIGTGGVLGYCLGDHIFPLFAEEGGKRAAAKACIVLWMAGGPSQIDTFDPKPGRPTGGSFKAIETAVRGLSFSEHFPLLAKEANRLGIIRTMTAKEGNHQRASYLLHTGYPPQGTVIHPSLGSTISADLGKPDFDLPNCVSIGGPTAGAGFLGANHNPYVVSNPNKPPDNLQPQYGLGAGRTDDRLKLLEFQDGEFARSHDGPESDGHKAIYRKAADLMKSPLVKAFDLSQEKPEVRDRYGRNNFGQGCIMARRLVESGVKYVEVSLGGWDTHKENFEQIKKLSSVVDPAFSTLLQDMSASGLLRETVVVWMGEFGRTPKINENDGRDHFPKAWTVLLAGGGIGGGRIVGETNEDGTGIKSRPVTVPDLFATLASQLGLNPAAVKVTPQGRPVTLVDNSGTAIKELVD